MKKELPKIKKSLKSFIIEEDAKVMDKTATKVALAVTFASLTFLDSVDDVNAKGHSNHYHKNNLLTEDFKTVQDQSGEDFEVTKVTHTNGYTHQNSKRSWYKL